MKKKNDSFETDYLKKQILSILQTYNKSLFFWEIVLYLNERQQQKGETNIALKFIRDAYMQLHLEEKINIDRRTGQVAISYE